MLGTFSPYAVVHQDSCVKIDDDIPSSWRRWSAAGSRPVSAPRSTGPRSGRATPWSWWAPAASGPARCRAPGSPAPKYIIAVDPYPFRREQAELLGATHSVASMEEAMPLVTELTRGVMADRTILTASLATGDLIKPLLLLTRKGGRCCLTSTANPAIDQVDLVLVDVIFGQKEIVGNVFGGLNPHADLPRLLSLYRSGELKLEELVTKRYALEQVNEGYDDLLNGRIMRGMIVF